MAFTVGPNMLHSRKPFVEKSIEALYFGGHFPLSHNRVAYPYLFCALGSEIQAAVHAVREAYESDTPLQGSILINLPGPAQLSLSVKCRDHSWVGWAQASHSTHKIRLRQSVRQKDCPPKSRHGLEFKRPGLSRFRRNEPPRPRGHSAYP
eukprot:6198823-Pleurochrysis_carterae.AAC.9